MLVLVVAEETEPKNREYIPTNFEESYGNSHSKS